MFESVSFEDVIEPADQVGTAIFKGGGRVTLLEANTKSQGKA